MKQESYLNFSDILRLGGATALLLVAEFLKISNKQGSTELALAGGALYLLELLSLRTRSLLRK